MSFIYKDFELTTPIKIYIINDKFQQNITKRQTDWGIGRQDQKSLYLKSYSQYLVKPWLTNEAANTFKNMLLEIIDYKKYIHQNEQKTSMIIESQSKTTIQEEKKLINTYSQTNFI